MKVDGESSIAERAVRLLVVDDRSENLLAIEAILQSTEYELELVSSGDAALKQLLEHDFAAVLIDVLMPGMDGFELAALIKQRERSRHTPIIFLTASDSPISYRGYSVGAVDYLTKPVDPDVLRAKVAIFVELFRKDLRIREQAEELRRAERREREHQIATMQAASEARYRNLAEAIPQIVWTADARGTISYFNHRWADYTGEAASAWTSCVHPDDHARCLRLWTAGLAGGKVFELEFRLRRVDGHYGWHLCRAVPEHDPGSGQLVGWLGTFTDCDDLKRAADAAQQAVRVRDEFLSIASHELRTPLTTLGLRLGGLEKDLHSVELQDRQRFDDKVGSARKQTSRLVALVDSLLSVSRITRGHVDLQPKSFDLVLAIREVLDRFRELAESSQVTLAFDATGTIVGHWDRLRIEQILDNLIGNAIKYAPRAPVEVGLVTHHERVEVIVQDHGGGIAAADHERIFGPFERAVSTRNYGGLGLGLFIARQNARAHGGDLRLSSELGQGSRFVVELPWRASPG